ncbi:MAG: hypothetical protein M1831_001512 [Alyxoria varia]|nr:MAG: hypothetical protein M1831_001512 [Alyxoria varia]
MPRVISDSDDEEEVDDLGEMAEATDAGNLASGPGEGRNGEHVEDNAHELNVKSVHSYGADDGHQESVISLATRKPCVEQDGIEVKTQSTGSTERLLREGHEEIVHYTPSTTGKRKREDSNEAGCPRRISSAAHTGTSSNKETRSKLKRVKSSAETTKEKKSARKKAGEDAFVLPLSSSPSGAKDQKDDAHKMKPPARGYPEPSSTVMNTSSDERRAKEVLQQANASQASLKTPERFKDETSSGWTDESKYNPSATPSNFEKTPTESSAQPNQSAEPVVVIAQPTNRAADSASMSGAKPSKGKQNFGPEDSPDAKINTADEVTVGLPAEQYKPRPSRSRSNRVASTQESQVATEPLPTKKSKATRSKSMPNPAPAGVEHLQEMGFQASQARSALLQKAGNVEEAANMLLEGPPSHDKEDNITLGSNKHKKRAKIGQDAADSEDELSTIQISVSNKVQADRIDNAVEDLGSKNLQEGDVSRATRNRGRPKKDSKGNTDLMNIDESAVTAPQSQALGNVGNEEDRDDTTDAPIGQQFRTDPEAEHSQLAQVESKAPATGKKKGRGRPKKNQAKDEGLVLDEAEKLPQDAPISGNTGALKERAPPNKDQTAGDDTGMGAVEERPDAHEADAAKAAPTAAGANESKENDAPATPSPQKPASHKQSASPTKKTTPLSKGRVPHRVGLSKKTKIEPLLKVKRG